MNDIYFGESICQFSNKNGVKCNRKAYYMTSDKLVACGFHGKKETRITLPKNPHASKIKQEEIQKHNEECKMIAEKNKLEGRMGKVCCSKLKMFGSIKLTPGFINIFPNFKHGHRKDGLGLPSLSPKSIGCIES